jgi:hypothetical protein
MSTRQLKNAVAVCLISFFSATLVVLIARSLDNQAASRLEPQLTQIAEELHAIRAQGGISAAPGKPEAMETLDDGLIVYYFHGDFRCPTCRAIESQTHETVKNDFADRFESGQIGWKVLNYDKPESAELAKKFDVHMANVVLARTSGGRIEDWKRLDEVWALVGDKPAFARFMRAEISQMLGESAPPADPAEIGTAADETTPPADLPGQRGPLDIPLPSVSPPPLPAGGPAVAPPLPE